MVILLALCGIFAGGGVYYLQVFGYYNEVPVSGTNDVQMTSLASGAPEGILYENFRAIDAESSPLRYRACFDTAMSQALLTETYEIYPDPVPNRAPGWFDCFDAEAIGAALDAGTAIAFMGKFNVVYGFDRVIAIDEAGQGFVWHQLNECGEKAFDGDPLPEFCPPPPDPAE